MVTEEAIGAALRRTRRDRGVTQGEIAKVIGKATSTVAGIETGVRGLRVSEALAIADHLNVPLAFLTPGDHQVPGW